MKKILCFSTILLLVLMSISAQARDLMWEGGPYFDMGVFAFENEDYIEAEKNILEAFRMNPENPNYNMYLGKIYMAQKQYNNARKYFETAWRIAPYLPGLKYDIAMLNYYELKYPEAADLFMGVYKDDPSNVYAGYHAGLCLFKQMKYNKAIPYFLEIAEKNSYIKIYVYYLAGLCYAQTRNIRDAIPKIKYVVNNSEKGLLKDYAQKTLNTLNQMKKGQQPLNLYARFGFRYDDNVKFEPDDEDRLAGADNKESSDLVLIGNFGSKFNYVQPDRYKLSLGFNFHKSGPMDVDGSDITGMLFDFSGQYNLKPVVFSFHYMPCYFWLSQESYLMRHRLRPKLKWNISNKLSGGFQVSIDYNNYLANYLKDGTRFTPYFDLSLLMGKNKLYGGLGYSINSADDSYYNYNKLNLLIGMSISLPKELGLNLKALYHDKNYVDIEPGFNVKRNDTKYTAYFSINRKFVNDILGVLFEYKYDYNDSNLNHCKYKRNTATLTFSMEY